VNEPGGAKRIEDDESPLVIEEVHARLAQREGAAKKEPS
jgi:hypothetical protein